MSVLILHSLMDEYLLIMFNDLDRILYDIMTMEIFKAFKTQILMFKG